MPAPTPTRALVLGLLLASLAPRPAAAEERYYVMIFGSESSPKQLRRSHTWATFVKAEGEGTDPNAYALTAQTISWLPKSLDVRVWRFRPEEGVNLSHEDTMRYVLAEGEHVTMWGPFVIQAALYERARGVISVANSGRARYRAISTGADMLISDCIHAVAAVDPELGRSHYPLIRVGIPASRYIARQIMMRSVYDQTAYNNLWLVPRLGIDRHPVRIVPPQQIPKRGCVLCLRPD